MITGKRVAPTSTLLLARVMIFQPSQRPQESKREWMYTSHGRCRVTGRLGQRHADIMESILYVAEGRRKISDGGIELLVDPAKLRRTFSANQYSHDHMKKLLGELRAAAIEIVTPEMESRGESFIGGLVDHIIPSPKTRYDPLTKGERHLWKVRLGMLMVKLIENDLFLHYSPTPIARLQYGISQALVRHVLTHTNIPRKGWDLDTLIEAVGGKTLSSSMLRNYRWRVKNDAAGLLENGIKIEEGNKVKRFTDAR